MKKVDVIIIGAGAAGLMCAIEAGKRGRSVVILDHANKVGKKILMSGGGRCNFTNLDITHDKFSSNNPHFFKSALSRYTQWDFINLVKRHKIPFHEKTLGQLFCDKKASDIVTMLLQECDKADVSTHLNTQIQAIKPHHKGFIVKSPLSEFQCEALVIATGGLSIPTMGASPFGYKVAQQFGLSVQATRAGLVPLTLHVSDKEKLSPLSGIAVASNISNKNISFHENMLFTHRGLSGPAILQISSYWQPGEKIAINLLPDCDLIQFLQSAQQQRPQILVKNLLNELLPKKLILAQLPQGLSELPSLKLSTKQINELGTLLQRWIIQPNGTEGYRTAEVTLGGVDTRHLSSKTMEAIDHPGLYFIGEVVDVHGWLGGYNFQWAWSSGWACGQVV